MKAALLIIFAFTLPLFAEVSPDVIEAPDNKITEKEEKFVGMWKGSRSSYRWEIHRKKDRTFEIAFSEPDPENLIKRFKNYARGVWWIEGDEYKFAWNEWWGDEGDLGGIFVEPIKSIAEEKIITLTEDDVDPENVEIRVKEFTLSAWKLKPEEP